MNYSPPGFYVWDSWYMAENSRLHAYHLQQPRNPAGEATMREVPLGHAVTENFLDWTMAEPILQPDPTLKDDDMQHWTGSALWHEGCGYLYYTMRSSQNEGRIQQVGLALSDDATSWKRYTGNPLMVPDERWYATSRHPVPGVLDCRDFHVIAAPQGGWLGYFATRQLGTELAETSVIGCAYSRDLIHWEQRAPAFSPGKYACIEVPDVFPLNGLWYLICLTGNAYGNRGIFTDPHLTCGTIYAVADRPEGPFRELADNVFLGGGVTTPIAARSVAFLDDLFVMYTDRERVGRTDNGPATLGTLTTPKLLRTSGDRLVAKYSPLIERKVGEVLFSSHRDRPKPPEIPWGQIWPMTSARWTAEDTIHGRCDRGWAVQPLTDEARSFILEARVELDSAAAAGVVLRTKGHQPGAMSGFVLCLDAQRQCLTAADLPCFYGQQHRQVEIRQNQVYLMRVVQRIEHVEVYLDEVLLLTFALYQDIEGGIGLFVDRGSAAFSQILLRTLEVEAVSAC